MGFGYSGTLRLTALAVLAASVHACSSESTSPDTARSAALTSLLNEVSQPGIDAIGGTLVRVPSIFFFAPLAPLDCTYDGSSMSFVCPQANSRGFTIDRSFTLYDGAGNKQAQFSGTSTATMQMITHVAGTSTYVGGTMTLDYFDNRTLSGLGTTQHVLNGISTETTDDNFVNGTSQEHVSDASVTKIENLLLPSGLNRWPGPGTVTSDNTTSYSGYAPIASHLQAVFNGTKCVTVSTTSGASSRTIVIDLSSSAPTATCTP
jgi:hypothetical protein